MKQFYEPLSFPFGSIYIWVAGTNTLIEKVQETDPDTRHMSPGIKIINNDRISLGLKSGKKRIRMVRNGQKSS